MSKGTMSHENADLAGAIEGVARREEVENAMIDVIKDAGKPVNFNTLLEEIKKRTQLGDGEIGFFIGWINDLVGKGDIVKNEPVELGKTETYSIPE